MTINSAVVRFLIWRRNDAVFIGWDYTSEDFGYEVQAESDFSWGDFG